jgi:hypothetical protein
MKTPFLLLTVALGALTGCVVSLGGGGGGGHHDSPPPVVVVPEPLTATEKANLAEIDAAARLTFDNERLEALSRIARRPDLGTAPLVHLVNTAYRSLSFDNQKVQLLRTLIEHPGFNDAIRHAIVQQLGKLGFDNQRQEILQAIDRRLQAD